MALRLIVPTNDSYVTVSTSDIPSKGAIVIDDATGVIKVGNGTSNVASLDPVGGSTGGGDSAPTVRPGVFPFEKSNAGAALGITQPIVIRRRIVTPRPTKARGLMLQWSNYNFLTNSNVSGSLTNCNAAFGYAAKNSDGSLNGNCTTTPIPVTLSGTTLTGGNKLTSSWLSPTTFPVSPYQDLILSLSWNMTSSDQLAFGGGEQWYSTNKPDALTAAPAGSWTYVNNQGWTSPDVIYDHDGLNFVVIGNSLSGGGSAGSPVVANHGEIDSIPGQLALMCGGSYANLAVAGSWAADFGASSPKYGWYDGITSPSFIPDFVLIPAITSSDIAGTGGNSSQIAAVKANFAALMLRVRAKWPNALVVATNNPPRVASTGSGTTVDTLEYARLQINDWLHSKPYDIDFCVDIDSIVSDWANPARLRPVYDPNDGTHGRPRYYTRVAAEIFAYINRRFN